MLTLRVEVGGLDRSPWLSANERVHWAVRACVVRAWRQAARAQGLRAGVRALGWQRVHVVAHLHFADQRRRDPGNYAATVVKAAVDGLVADAGLVPDDDWSHLEGPDVRLGAPASRARRGVPARAAITFVVTDLGAPLTRRTTT